MKLSVVISSACLLLGVSVSQAWSPLPSNSNPSPPLSSAAANTRRSFVSSLLVSSGVLIQSTVASAAEEDESFASIAARASKISQSMVDDEAKAPSSTTSSTGDGRTAYDFTLPMAGQATPIKDIVRNQDNRVKAILFVNIKQDDPIARKNIPEFIALAAKYVSVTVCCVVAVVILR